MSNSQIQILRSYANTTPLSLNDGELAYSFVSNTMFIGDQYGDIIAIGGQVYANKANNALANTTGTFGGDLTIAGNVAIANTTASTSNTTGALIVSGGMGVTGNVYIDSIYITSNNISANGATVDGGRF